MKCFFRMDARVKPGHDELRSTAVVLRFACAEQRSCEAAQQVDHHPALMGDTHDIIDLVAEHRFTF